MKKQILSEELKRMQELAGVLKLNEGCFILKCALKSLTGDLQ